MNIKAIIVDDEKNGRENLAGILTTYCPNVVVVGAADSVDAAIPLISANSPDLVFLDIEMPRANGFRLLEHFRIRRSRLCSLRPTTIMPSGLSGFRQPIIS